MKLFITLLITSILLTACADNGGRKSSANGLCSPSNLNLATYKPIQSQKVDLPSNPNKSDDDIKAIDGTYVLHSAIIHVHDKNFPLPDSFQNNGQQYLQFSIAYSGAARSPKDIKDNTVSFQGSVNCISGLLPDYAGKLNYFSNVPTVMEIKNIGSNFVPKQIKTVEFGYKADRSIKFISNPISGSDTIDQIEEINPSDIIAQTNIYKVSPTSELYQLQSRVQQGNLSLTLINTYTRCVDPNESKPNKNGGTKVPEPTPEELKVLTDNYQLCLDRNIVLKSQF